MQTLTLFLIMTLSSTIRWPSEVSQGKLSYDLSAPMVQILSLMSRKPLTHPNCNPKLFTGI